MAVIELRDVEAAWEAVRDQVRHTPVKRSTTLGALAGGTVYLKLENFQRTGSFKVRGALNRIRALSPAECQRGVVCASAGNHAQGVAFAAAKSGVRCTVFMPEEATLSKVAATRGYGAEVHLAGKDYQEAYEHAERFARDRNAVFVHAFDDPLVMAGQGTLGLEILEDVPDVDTVLVPIGGGGLISGIATALKGHDPRIKVYGVQAEGASTVAPSLEKGAPVSLEKAETMADGIAVRNVGRATFPIIQERVDGVVTVSEAEIASAILFLLERAKVVVEGAGAVTLAAILHGKVDLKGRTAVAVVSGGNIDMPLVSRIIRRGLVKEGRIAVVQAVLMDRPGALAKFLTLLGDHKANVLEIHHDRHRVDIPLHRTVVEVHVETRGPGHVRELQAALRGAGYEATLTGA